MGCLESAERSLLRADQSERKRRRKKCGHQNCGCEVRNEVIRMPVVSNQDVHGILRRMLCSLSAQWRSIFRVIVLPALASIILSAASFAQEEYFNHTELNWFTIETTHFFV